MSRTSTPWLLRRLHRPLRPATWALTVVVAILAAVLLAAPTAFTTLTSQAAERALESGTPTARYLVGRPDELPEPDGDGGYDGYAERLADVRAALPPDVRASTGPARWAITLENLPIATADPGAQPPGAGTQLSLKVDPEARDEVNLVEGTWPEDASDDGTGGPVPVALSVESARALGWTVGEERVGHLLTGTWRPRDAGADYWALNPSMVRPYVFDNGNARVVVTGTAFTSQRRWTESVEAAQSSEVQVWYPIDVDAVGDRSLEALLPQLRQVAARTSSGSADTSFTLQVAGLEELETARTRVASARAVLTLAAVGPVGAAAMVLVLAVRGFAARRRAAVGLLANRGASPARLRALLALEGLLVGLPAGLVALLLVRWLLGPPSPTGLLLAALVVLLPPALLAATPIRAAMRPGRADVGLRREWRHRRVAEAAVLLLAAASTYLLTTAGLGAGGDDVDALVVATPLLLSGAACVLVLRLYPLPLRLLAGRLARGRSTIGFLGAVRALRDPAVRVAPVLTVLVAAAVSVFSVLTLATLERGAAQTALARTGAEVRLDGPVIDDAAYAEVRGLPGVAAAARVQEVGRTTAFVQGSVPQTVTLHRADLAALARVQAEVRGGVPRSVGTGEVVLAEALSRGTDTVGVGDLDDLEELPVAAAAPGVPGVVDGDAWLVADASTRGDAAFLPRVLLVSLEEGADAEAVTRGIDRITGSRGTTTMAGEAVRALQDEPVARGVRVFLVGATAVVVVAALAAVALALAMGAATRTRHLAVLRVLGVPASQRRWYAVWELVPALTVALAGGAALGLGLAVVVQRVVDLAPFAGGGGQPPLVVPGAALGLLLAGFVVVVGAAVAAGVWVAGRRTPADSIRMDEE